MNNKKDSIGNLDKKTRSAIRGWCIYDWANSAFFTSAGTAIFPIYFVVAFQAAFGSQTKIFGITFTIQISANLNQINLTNFDSRN